MNSLNDKDFSLLTTTEKVQYLNEHNHGYFRELTKEEREYYNKKLNRNTQSSTKAYAIREETNDLVVKENTYGWNGKLFPRLFVNIKHLS